MSDLISYEKKANSLLRRIRDFSEHWKKQYSISTHKWLKLEKKKKDRFVFYYTMPTIFLFPTA